MKPIAGALLADSIHGVVRMHSCHNLACDKNCYNSNINPFAEEASEPSKRKVDTPEEHLKWKFSKVKGKNGLYFEYKAVSTKNTLVIP